MEDKRSRTIRQIIRYCDPKSVLIVTTIGRLIRVHCPFQVQVVQVVQPFWIGQTLTVTAVRTDHNLRLLYQIGGEAYHHHFFIIEL